MVKYYENIITGALFKDFIPPTYRAYWKEITRSEYEEKLEQYMSDGDESQRGEE